ncbi:MAG: acetate--CoA ligase family protein [Candidatus Scalindua sp.]|jgi:acetyl-CoA synthetase (ADP-forming)|nr:acetate--CoA ligase family protein [Candidatus Scalindua sp.]MBT5305442.1 acetate--CoA ligase family protein [Candidatus Scalindua sp.]MBT6051604.1 acetate--CoA ligase family protein [Candidatus Scalindua sp.]MBT6227236.1 acetate--CoA ligase family protein [Candidatus Scalindua sp.]MBT6563984.1 acetate--CoA ligase family protein [Candidatus Scalindua sp.]
MVVETSKNREAEKIVEKILASERKVALPDESLAMVKLFGVDVPDYALVKTAEEAVAVSKEIGFPLVLKIASQDVPHKSDIGGVVINVENAQEVERNYHKVLDNLKRVVPEAQIGGVLVQKQLPEATHLIVGGVYDEQFGPAVMFGLGGVFVELFKDVSFRIAPVAETEALEMIKEIKAYPVLSGYRGSKKLDIEQMTKTIINISELITNISTIKEVELNPLFAYEKSVTAVDARIILK